MTTFSDCAPQGYFMVSTVNNTKSNNTVLWYPTSIAHTPPGLISDSTEFYQYIQALKSAPAVNRLIAELILNTLDLSMDVYLVTKSLKMSVAMIFKVEKGNEQLTVDPKPFARILRNSLVDPYIWEIEEPMAFLKAACEDIMNRPADL